MGSLAQADNDLSRLHLNRTWRRKRVRAGVLKTVSIDVGDAESQYRFEPADDMTPDRIFDHKWALTLLDRVLGLLAQEYAEKDRADVFDRLKVVLSQGKLSMPSAELAAQLGTTEGAIHTAVHRLKKRYRAILHARDRGHARGPVRGG
jgi:DNA-directed RNA polymerase specialized sigma24 family protein